MCDKRCLECTNYSECISCPKGRSLNIETSTCNCSEGQFDIMSYWCLGIHLYL